MKNLIVLAAAALVLSGYPAIADSSNTERPLKAEINSVLWRASIIVDDFEPSLKLYRDILGMQPVYDRATVKDPRLAKMMGLPSDTPVDMLILRSADVNVGTIGFLKYPGLAKREASTSIKAPPVGEVLFLIKHTDVMGVYEKMKTAGFTVTTPPERKADGTVTDLFAVDPSGIRLMIVPRNEIGVWFIPPKAAAPSAP